MSHVVRWTLVAAAISAPTPAFPQGQRDLEVLAEIREAGIERPEAGRLFYTLTDVFGPRVTGSPAHVSAATWARDEFLSWGLAGARLEAFDFGRGWSLEKQTLEMTAPYYMPLIGVADAWAPSTDGEVTGDALYLGDMTSEEMLEMGNRLRGAIVLVDPPQAIHFRHDRIQPTEVDHPVRTGSLFTPTPARPQMMRRGFTSRELPRLGPAAMLYPSIGRDGTVYVGGNRATPPDGPPMIRVAAEQYNQLVRLVRNGQRVELRVGVRTRFHEDDPNSYNVLAEIPGTDPDLRNQVVLLGAHLDSWHAGTGATDNADASATVMEAMRILAAIDVRPRRTIRVALWSGEEQRFLGSTAYVQQHLASQTSRDAVSVYLNDDPGTGPTYGFYMEENAPAMALFDEWLEPLRDLGVRRNVFEGISGTDHLPFDEIGIPAFTAIKDYTDYDTRTHHTNLDLSERVSVEDLTQSAIVLASIAWMAAVSEEKVPRRPPSEEGVGRWGVAVGDATTADPIPGVRVRIEGTDYEGVTDEGGFVVFEDLESASRTIVLEHPDYDAFRRENYPIRAGRLSFSPVWLTPR